MNIGTTIGGIVVTVTDWVVSWTGGLAIDCDGSPRAYAPKNSGLPALDFLANAGKPGGWWGLATNSDGTPIIQASWDPQPGYYVSTTALQNKNLPLHDPYRYVDSEKVCYLSIPPDLHLWCRVGDVAYVVNTRTGDSTAAVVADIGPAGKLGEGSIALANALGVDPDPRRGGTNERIIAVELYRGSHGPWPRPWSEICEQVDRLRTDFGA